MPAVTSVFWCIFNFEYVFTGMLFRVCAEYLQMPCIIILVGIEITVYHSNANENTLPVSQVIILFNKSSLLIIHLSQKCQSEQNIDISSTHFTFNHHVVIKLSIRTIWERIVFLPKRIQTVRILRQNTRRTLSVFLRTHWTALGVRYF